MQLCDQGLDDNRMDGSGTKVFTEIHLERKKWKPGDLIIRFGDWRKGEPCVMIDNARWNRMGNPETVTVVFTDSASM